MIISCIVAQGINGEIGINNDLPWRLSSDLKFFKKTTMGHHILMGRKNFNSIGRALPGRTSIVLTRDPKWYRSDVHVVHSLEEGISLAHERGEEELFIIGGGKIYDLSQNFWDRLYLTQVEVSIPNANVFFPKLDYSKWKLISEEPHSSDEKNEYNFSFKLFERINS